MSPVHIQPDMVGCANQISICLKIRNVG